jgi:hypothetical protein
MTQASSISTRPAVALAVRSAALARPRSSGEGDDVEGPQAGLGRGVESLEAVDDLQAAARLDDEERRELAQGPEGLRHLLRRRR